MSAGLTYFKYSLDGDRIFAIYDGQCEIAQVPISKYNPMGSEDFACLFAAAPELLAGAKSALNFIRNSESELGITLESGDLLRAAIAKAEKQP